MSAQAVGWVFAYSPHQGFTRLVQLAVADSVNDQNCNEFWMSVGRLARKAGVSVSTVRRSLRELEDTGHLSLLASAEGETRRYRFLMPNPGQSDTPPGQSDRTPPVSLIAPPGQSDRLTQEEPKIEPKLNPARSSRRKPQLPLPAPFVLDDEHFAWAEVKCPRVDVEAETENFVYWWRAKDGRHADWYAAWRNWMRKAERRLASGPQRRPA